MTRQQDLILDYNRPVLDITYQNISSLSLDQPAEEVKALIITGNPVNDFRFIKFFPNLQLIHGDSMGITDFQDMRLESVPKLQHLIVRQNLLSNMDCLPSSDALCALDISQNDFPENSEESWQAILPRLRRLTHGFVTAQPSPSEQISCSRSRLNSLRLFKKVFLERFYEETAQLYADLNACACGPLLFTLLIKGGSVNLDVKKTSDISVKNYKIIITTFAVITGFEVVECSQQVRHLSDLIAPNRLDLNLSEHFTSQTVNYPTQSSNTDPSDQIIFQLLSNRQEDQAALRSNYNLITLELQQQVLIFIFDRKTNQFLNYSIVQQQVQKQISLREGIPIKMQKAQAANPIQNLKKSVMQDTGEENMNDPETQRQTVRFADLVPMQNTRLLVTQNQNITKVKYYITFKTRAELVQEAQEQVYELLQERLSTQRAIDALTMSFRQLNKENRKIIPDEDDRMFIYLTLSVSEMQIPIRIELSLIFTSNANTGFLLNNSTYQKYVIGEVQLLELSKIIASEFPVRYIPNVVKLELENLGKGTIIAKVFETVDGKIKQCTYKGFQYIFFRNNQKIKEDAEPYLNLENNKAQQEGLFKAILTIKDENGCFVGEEIESDNLYIKASDEQENEYDEVEDENQQEQKSKVNDEFIGKLTKTKDEMNDSRIGKDVKNTPKQAAKMQESMNFVNKPSGSVVQTPQAQKAAQVDQKIDSILQKSQMEKSKLKSNANSQLNVSTISNKNKTVKQTKQDQEMYPTVAEVAANVPPLHYNVKQYSRTVGQKSIIEFKPGCAASEPKMIIPFCQQHSSSTGLTLSQAKVETAKNNAIYSVEVEFSENDVGKMMFLYVYFEEDLYQLIPITYQPIISDTEINVNYKPYYVDVASGEFLPTDITYDDADQTIITISKKNPITFSTKQVEVIPLSLESLNPDSFSRDKLLKNKISFESIEYYRLNSVLKFNYQKTFTFSNGPLFPNDVFDVISKMDKKQYIKNNCSQFAAICQAGYCVLVAFADEMERNAFCLDYSKHNNTAFPYDYEDKQVKQQLSQSIDLSSAQQLDILKIKSQGQKIQIIQNLQPNEITTDAEINIQINVANEPSLDYLISPITYALFLGQSSSIFSVKQFQGLQGVIKTSAVDAGLKILIINGQSTHYLTPDTDQASYVLMKRNQEKDITAEYFQKCDDMTLQAQVEAYEFGQYVPCTVYIKKGFIAIKSKLKAEFNPKYTETTAFCAGGVHLVLCGGIQRLLVKCNDDDKKMLWFCLNFESAKHFYQ